MLTLVIFACLNVTGTTTLLYVHKLYDQNMFVVFGIILSHCSFSQDNIFPLQALCGIINGAIMKQASSLTRIIMIAGAMLVSTTLSVLIFRLHFNAYFITAFILVIFAMVFYHRPER